MPRMRISIQVPRSGSVDAHQGVGAAHCLGRPSPSAASSRRVRAAAARPPIGRPSRPAHHIRRATCSCVVPETVCRSAKRAGWPRAWKRMPETVPDFKNKNGASTAKCLPRLGNLAEWTGLEPATPGVTGRYSNQLNYHSWQAAFACIYQHKPSATNLATLRGFEPRYSP